MSEATETRPHILLTGSITYRSDESITDDNCSVHGEYQHREDTGGFDARIVVSHHRPEAPKWAYTAVVGECCLAPYLMSLRADGAEDITITSPNGLRPVIVEVMCRFARCDTNLLGGAA
jgi:hypothetical protein